MHLLDTNACIRILNADAGPLVERLRAEHPSHIRISSVTKAELLYGARHGTRIESNLKRLERFFALIVSLPFDDPCAEHFGIIRADLAARGEPIGPYDMQIAATARAHDLTLVTHNVREFSRVPGLRLEDWE